MEGQEESPQMQVRGKGSLEIFLFTNGQQESPPRKYNVRVNDRWDTTLNFLARSQDGSNHAIDLYTTEGKKIEKAQELSSGAAYVAVQPPSAFLPAGYNDYLRKATRSREKRQEKMTASDSLKSLPKPDKNNSKDKLEEGSKDITNIKIIQDIEIRSNSKTTIEEQGDMTNQAKSDTAKAIKPLRSMNLKQPQKRSNVLPQQNLYTMRKNANNVTPPIKRGSNPSKIDANKKKVEISSVQNTKNAIASAKDGSIIRKTNVSKSKDDEARVIGVISRTRNTETVKTYHLQKNTDMASMPGTVYKATQNLTPDSTLIERNILLPVSQEKEPRESAYIIPIHERSLTLLSNQIDTVCVPSQDAKNTPELLNSSPLPVSPHADFPKGINSRAAVLTKVPRECFQEKTFFGNETNDNNFAIYIKRGNLVNLKINIEVENVSSTTFEANRNQLSASSVLNTPIKKIDGDSPASNTAKNYRDAPTLTEPWLSRLPYEQFQQITNDLTVGVCKCCSCCRNPESVSPVYVDNNNYFIVLPPEDVNKPLVSCTCKLKINQQSNCEIPEYKDVKLSKTDDHVVKLVAGKNSPTHTRAESFEVHDPVSMSIDNQLLSKNISITEEEANQCDCYATSTQYQTSPCDCAPSLALECAACDHEHDNGTDVVKQNAQANNKSAMRKEAFTQTDWSGIVLEARPLEDGSYAFHIPSLKVLKNTNNLY